MLTEFLVAAGIVQTLIESEQEKKPFGKWFKEDFCDGAIEMSFIIIPFGLLIGVLILAFRPF